MSAFPGTAQPTLGIGRLGAALIGVALAIILVVVLAFGQFATAQPRTAPAAGAAPAQWDHGTSSGELYDAAGSAPATWDHGTSSGELDGRGISTGPSYSPNMRKAE